MIIDVHTHIGKLNNSRFEGEFSENLQLLEEEMKSNKVDVSLILCGYDPTKKHDPTTEQGLAVTAGHSQVRIVGSVNLQGDIAADVQNMDDLLREKKIVAIKLYPGYQFVYPSDKKCYPIYELCRTHRVPVIFHSGDTLNNYEVRGKVKYSHPLHIDDVAVDFPDVAIVIAHLGNPWIDDCAELLYKNANVYADMSGIVVGEGLDTPYAEWMRRRITDLAHYASPDKLLYGTDWPLARMKDYITFTESLGFPPETMERIFSKNAIEIFHLTL